MKRTYVGLGLIYYTEYNYKVNFSFTLCLSCLTSASDDLTLINPLNATYEDSPFYFYVLKHVCEGERSRLEHRVRHIIITVFTVASRYCDPHIYMSENLCRSLIAMFSQKLNVFNARVLSHYFERIYVNVNKEFYDAIEIFNKIKSYDL